MNEQRYRSTAGPALASMDNWNAQQNRRPVMLADSEPAADMVERAAKAIHEFRYQSGDEPRSWEGILKAERKYHVDHGSQWYRQLARAALQAAAGPTRDDTDLTTAYMTGYLAGKDAAAKGTDT